MAEKSFSWVESLIVRYFWEWAQGNGQIVSVVDSIDSVRSHGFPNMEIVARDHDQTFYGLVVFRRRGDSPQDQSTTRYYVEVVVCFTHSMSTLLRSVFVEEWDSPQGRARRAALQTLNTNPGGNN